MFFVVAGDFGARAKALAFATELVRATAHTITRIVLAVTTDAALTLGAAFDVAVIFEADAAFTNVVVGALDQFARVNTSSCDTLFAIGAFHGLAGVPPANVVHTLQAAGTFRATTLLTTASLDAYQA